MKVLLIEDDQETSAYVARGLREQGHVVDLAATGRDGLFLATDGGHDVLIVDRMLPGLDGIGLVQALRADGRESAGAVPDRARRASATGCAGWRRAATTIWSSLSPSPSCWPASTPWPAARRSAMRRRCCGPAISRWICSSARSCAAARRSSCNRASSSCSNYLMRNADRVVTRTMLLEAVWDFHFDPKTNIVETHISRLRSKLSQHGGAELIHTVRGAGYVLRVPGPGQS